MQIRGLAIKKIGFCLLPTLHGTPWKPVNKIQLLCLRSVVAIVRLHVSQVSLHLFRLCRSLERCWAKLIVWCIYNKARAQPYVHVKNITHPRSVRPLGPAELLCSQLQVQWSFSAAFHSSLSAGRLSEKLNLSWKSLPSVCKMQFSAALPDLFKMPFLKARYANTLF